MPLVAGIEEGVALHGPEVVVDLSDEPVLSPSARLLLASRSLACGVPYVGADFRFEPPAPRAVPAALARRLRDRQAGRQDGGHGPPRAVARARPGRPRRRDGPRRPARAGGGRGRADGRRPARALPRGASRRLGSSRDRGARRRADDRLPAVRRRARRRDVRVQCPGGGRARRRARSGRRGVRRQRRCDSAGRDRPPDSGRARPRCRG